MGSKISKDIHQAAATVVDQAAAVVPAVVDQAAAVVPAVVGQATAVVHQAAAVVPAVVDQATTVVHEAAEQAATFVHQAAATIVDQATAVVPAVVDQATTVVHEAAEQAATFAHQVAAHPAIVSHPDHLGTCPLLPNVNNELRVLKSLRLRDGEQFPGSSTRVDLAERYRWMEYFSLPELPINMIVWPGTHDSATNDIGIPVITRPFAECQTLSIYEQLRFGVRALDIRIQQDCRVCHSSVVGYGIHNVISDIKRFMAETNLEIIILEIRTEYGHSNPPGIESYLVAQLGELLIHQNNEVFSKTISEVLPRRIVCIWKPRNSPMPEEGGPLWNASYIKDDWINTDMPLTKFDGNMNNLRNQSPVSERKFFYKVEHTLTAQMTGDLLIWTKHVYQLTRRIRGFARLFLAKCHKEGILNLLQIYSTDFIDDNFIAACIGLNHARLMMIINDVPASTSVCARDLSIAWGEDTRYWKWSHMDESDNHFEVAELLSVCWLHVHGKFEIAKLVQGITYKVIYVVMLKDSSHGWVNPVNLRLILPNGNNQERTENLNEKPRGVWIAISVGNFTISSEMVGEIKFSLDNKNGYWKGGLIIKNVVIMPDYT